MSKELVVDFFLVALLAIGLAVALTERSEISASEPPSAPFSAPFSAPATYDFAGYP